MTEQTDLLARLDPAARSAALHRTETTHRPAILTTPFADLLALAAQGKITSDLPVDVSPMLDLELSEADAQRVAWAVDQAEAAGATRALVLLDGEGLLVDVPARRIEGLATEPGAVLTEIDTVVIAPRPDGTTGLDDPALLNMPREHIVNQSLRGLLADVQQALDDSQTRPNDPQEDQPV
ncbi:MAG: hypothetical protein KAS72_01035 [Phycisphaerales bacterium]|nr:hypothetical protein [Phycisphaerales bacterium]